jgi:hypothetical protein
MSRKRSNPRSSSLRTQRTRFDDNDNSANVATGLATSTTAPRRRKSDQIVEIDWIACLSQRRSEVDLIAHSFSKIPLTEKPVDRSVFKEVLKNLKSVIVKGTVLAGIYHLVTTTREVFIIPHRKLVEYIRQRFVQPQFAVQPG